MTKVAEKIPSWISKILLPEIRVIVKEEVASEVKVLDARINTLDSKIESLRNEMVIRFDEFEKRINARFDSLEKRIPLIEKIAMIEARLERLEKEAMVQKT